MIIGIATAAETNLDSELVAQYLFNGNANDNTGHGHDGTVYGPIMAPDRFSNPDGAYYFDGWNDYIEVPDDPELKPQSVSLVTWVNVDPAGSHNSKAGSDGYVIFKRNVRTSNFEGYQISASPSRTEGTVSSTSGKQVSVVSLCMPGEWHQIAMTADSQYIKMYYDGEFVSAQPTGFPLNYAADNLYFGNSQEWFYKYYHGLIDDVSIYNRILSADEIHTIYSDTAPQTNLPPVLDEIGSQIIDEGQQLTFSVSATDPDGDALTFIASNVPTGAIFDETMKTFTWTPGYDKANTYKVTFTVSDGFLTDSQDVSITVNDVNQAPIANAGPDQSITVGSFIILDGSKSFDPDGDTSIYHLWYFTSKPKGSNAQLSDPTSIMPTFIVDKTGDYIIELIVTDSKGSQSQPDSVTITTTAKCDFSTKPKIEKCFGGIGKQCEGFPLYFLKDTQTCYVYGWMSVGSILHDRCCIATNNKGFMCAKAKTNECEANWYQALQDVTCGRTWAFSWGPYYAKDKQGDDTSRSLKVPPGAKISPDYQYLCKSGACKPDSNSFDGCGIVCECQ